MYVDIPMREKKNRMNMFTSMRSLMAAFVIAMAAFPGPATAADPAPAAASGVTAGSINVGMPLTAVGNSAPVPSSVATGSLPTRASFETLVLPLDEPTPTLLIIGTEGGVIKGPPQILMTGPTDGGFTLIGSILKDPVALPTGSVPSRKELGDVLALLKELTVDLKIEEEDKSTSYQRAKERIDGQSENIGKQLGGTISSPSKLDASVEALQKRLANAKTDDELKEIAAAIITLQTQTEIWASNTGILVPSGTDGTQFSVQVNETIKAVNDRVIAGVQNTIRSKPVTCTSAYDPGLHMVVTRCN